MKPTLLILFLLILPACRTAAQTQTPAPIERQPSATALPSAPQPAPTPAQLQADQDWEHLIQRTHYLRPEIRIQAVGDPIRCDVDKVTPDEILCTEHRAGSGPLANLLNPREQYHVPRGEVRDIRVGGRVYSTLLGLGIGIAVGSGVGSINAANRADGAPAILAVLFGGAGALIGHALPLRGTPIYRQP